MRCKHLGQKHTCSLNLFDGTPSVRDCANCWEYEAAKDGDKENEDWTADKPSRGLGDTVAKITETIGIKPCGGCKKRQEALNDIFKYGRSKNKRKCGCQNKDKHGTSDVTNTPDNSQETD